MNFFRKNRRRLTWTGAVLAVALLTWLLWPDRRLARVRALQAALSSDAAKALPPEQRRAQFEEMRTAMAALSSSQRQELSDDRQKRFEEELRRYRQMSPAEKRKHIDGQINRELEMRQRMQQNGNRPPGAGGPGAGGPPGGRGNRDGRPATPEQREQRRQRSLDRTSPEFRGLMDQYRKDMEARRQQRGLPVQPPRRPR